MRIRPGTWVGIVAVCLVVVAVALAVKPWSHQPTSAGITPGDDSISLPDDSVARNVRTPGQPLAREESNAPRMIAASSAEGWHKFDDPSQDGWSSEAFTATAAKQLKIDRQAARASTNTGHNRLGRRRQQRISWHSADPRGLSDCLSRPQHRGPTSAIRSRGQRAIVCRA